MWAAISVGRDFLKWLLFLKLPPAPFWVLTTLLLAAVVNTQIRIQGLLYSSSVLELSTVLLVLSSSTLASGSEYRTTQSLFFK
jgi:hypothetical protein